MASIADRIKEGLLMRNMKQADLVKLTGIGKSSISTYLSGEYEPKQKNIYKIAKALNVSESWLLGYDVPPEREELLIAQFDRNVVKIPVFPAVPAGTPIEALNDIIDWEEIPAKWLAGGKEYFGVVVKGNSMYPYYMEGDIVIVCKQPVCECGDDCIVYVNGYEATLKQVKLHEDGSMTLQPLNPEYAPRTYTPEEISSLPVMICGVVKELRRTRK